jgi:polysaccharide export outer membrane protein
MICKLRSIPAVALVMGAGACGLSQMGEGSGAGAQVGGRAEQAQAQKSTPPIPTAADAGKDAALRRVALTYASLSDPLSKSYKIGPLDVLEITVFKVPELSKTLQVSEAGSINFPLIGEIEAGGRTAREIEQSLTKQLGAKYLQNPQITVFVKEHNSQRITVEGAVKKPGVIPMAGGMSLLQAIAQAQGLEQTAETTAVVFRQLDGRRSAARYDIEDIRQGKADDPALESGDVIIVPTSDVKEGINMVVKFLPLATIIPFL